MTTPKKNKSSDTNDTQSAGVSPPPADGSVTPADGSAPAEGETILRARSPSHIELVACSLVVTELTSDADAFRALFGSSAPDPVDLAGRLKVAAAWSATTKKARTDAKSAQEQTTAAWFDLWPTLDALGPMFKGAAATNPAVQKTFPGLARFFGAKVVSAKKAAATRARNKKTDDAPEATHAAGTSAEPAAVSAPAPAAPSAPTTAKT